MQVVQGLSPYTDFPTGHPLYIGQSDRTLGNFRSIRSADLLLFDGCVHALSGWADADRAAHTGN